MSEHDRDSLREESFDSYLESSMPELPPDDVVYEVTPWRKAMNRVLIGMALSTITLSFLCLNYILPAIGALLSLLGFRTLRGENGWFRCCWFITLLRTAFSFPFLILNATRFQSAVYALPVTHTLTYISLALQFLLFLCLWRALLAVRRKAGLPAHAAGAVAMLVWYGVVCLLAVQQYSGLFVMLLLLVIYVLILRSLYRLSGELDEAGYTIRAAAVRIPDRAVLTAVLSVLAAGILCGYLFFSRYPMNWQPVESTGGREVEQVREQLLDLGFPETVLNDLTEEDILACRGALRVVADTEYYPLNNGRTEVEQSGNITYHYTVYDVKELQITGVAVELPGQQEQWKIFHHFLWTADTGFYGTESIQLWPAYQNSEGWAAVGDVSGRVLYDRDGRSYAASYYSLSTETYTYSSFFSGTQTATDVFAAFSMPRKGENQRGYLSYTIGEIEDGWIINSWINYTHQQCRLQYPVKTAMETRMSNNLNDSGAFKTVQDALISSAG
ncbi:MAG: hypothetical protein ACI4PC_07730 [Oscillospiraceae bacterium]